MSARVSRPSRGSILGWRAGTVENKKPPLPKTWRAGAGAGAGRASTGVRGRACLSLLGLAGCIQEQVESGTWSIYLGWYLEGEFYAVSLRAPVPGLWPPVYVRMYLLPMYVCAATQRTCCTTKHQQPGSETGERPTWVHGG